jgi:hypothetical protein
MKLVATSFLIFILSIKAYASTPIQNCGEFKAFGEIIKNSEETGYSLVVNKNTKSQYLLKIKLKDELLVSSYIDKKVSMNFLLNHLSNGMNAEIDKVISIKKIPYAGVEISKNNEIELIKKSECLK